MIQQFRKTKFNKRNSILMQKIKIILGEYAEQSIKVTTRQLYYQLVSRDIISNNIREYAKLSKLITNARYMGEIDWDAIEDRARIPNIPNTFKDIDDLLSIASLSYQLDRWENQQHYIELWTEKDAISSVISPITSEYQVPVSVNRGYSSASSMYASANRFLGHIGKKLILLYLGDHDPSGLDMDRDIADRLAEFGVNVKVIRIGLTSAQVKQYSPPPNPAKIKDPRAKQYIQQFGQQSWEVDALRPEILQQLIKDSILQYLDLDKFNAIKNQETLDIDRLRERVNDDRDS